MFGGTLWGGSIGGVDDHSDKEREPPARPIDLEFPCYAPPYAPRKLDTGLSSQARDRICHIRSFTELSDEDLGYFNIKFDHGVDVSRLLPQDQFQERPFLFDEDLDAMLTEISHNNQDAFREILRMEPLLGHAKPRLAYARNFFGSLEDIARYWDNSIDQYYHVPVDEKSKAPPTISRKSDGGARAVTTAKTDGTVSKDVEMKDVDPSSDSNVPSTKVKMREVYKGYRFGNGEQLSPGARVALVKNLLKMVTHKFLCRDHEPMPAPREKLIIRGVKIQSIQYQFCIAKMPKDTKLARNRVVEGPIMAVHCREELRFKQTPRIASAASVLTGTGTLEGTGQSKSAKPVLNDKAQPSATGFVGERYDLLREIGCMLILALQREREHKSKDLYMGSQNWWVAEKRWGGGPVKWGNSASEVYEDEDPSWNPEEKKLQDEKQQRDTDERALGKDAKHLAAGSKISVDALMADNAPTLPSMPGDPMTGPRKKKLRSLDRPAGKEEAMRDGRKLMYMPPFKKKWYQDWEKLKANTPMWDDKIIYKHIGRREGAEFDDIFMLTSVNHHIALLRMQVHPQYLDWLETGREVPHEEIDGFWKDVLYVQRSTWYDMFDIESRRSLLVALWRLMCWLNRDLVDRAEFEKMEEKRKNQQQG